MSFLVLHQGKQHTEMYVRKYVHIFRPASYINVFKKSQPENGYWQLEIFKFINLNL